MEESDAAAVARARAGDHYGFRVLEERHGRDRFRLAYRMRGDKQDAEDMAKSEPSMLKPTFSPIASEAAVIKAVGFAQPIIGLIFLCPAQAQTMNRSAEDGFIRMYNGTNNQALFAHGTTNWQHSHKVEDIAGWLDWMRTQTGRLVSSVVISNAGKYQYIRLDGERKVTGFMFQDADNGQFADFYFVPFAEPLSALELKEVHGDNPLVTPLDSAIEGVAAKFMVYNKPALVFRI